MKPAPFGGKRPELVMGAHRPRGLELAGQRADLWLSDPQRHVDVVARLAGRVRAAAAAAGRRVAIGMFRDGWIGDSRETCEKLWLSHALAVHRLYFNVGVYLEEFEPWVGRAYARVGRPAGRLAARIGLGAGDRFWTPLPFFHVGGFDVLFASLSAQAAMIHAGQFEPGAALAQLSAERVTHAFPAFETIWMAVLNHPDFAAADLSRLTTVINVGTPERMRSMQDRLPAAVQISCTGSTEGAGFVCVGDPADPPETRALYAGQPVAGMEARVVDPETGADLPDHTAGEFVFRGVSRFARYYRDPATTADRIDDDGWYHSGDLLERDAEGRFRFHSRLSDVLKVGGENVSAAEVEDRIAALPGVSVVQVVAAPDGHYGEVAAAFVELRPGASLTEAVAGTAP